MAEAKNEVTLDKIQAFFEATEDSLTSKMDDKFSGMTIDIATLKQKLETSSNKKEVDEIKKSLADRDIKLDDMYKIIKDNQPIIDGFIAEQGKRRVEKTDFKTGWNEIIQKNIFGKKEEEIVSAANRKDFNISMDLKVADMTTSASVTGDVVHSYNPRQGIVPSQKWNLREILNTTISPTGSYVTYRETGSTGAIAVQTEGQEKSVIDYAFTEIKTVSKYIAGVVTFSKHLMYHLPFLNNLLPRMLLRDFYKKENDYLYDSMIAAAAANASTPATPGGPATDIEEIIFWIANLRDADYDASYGIMDWSTWARMMKSGRNANSGYALPLSANGTSTGEINIAGTPLRGASWADPGEFLLWDNDFVERVETESLRVEFSYENGTNFTKNMITAKVECMEEINILRPDAILHGEFGGS